MSGYNFAQGFLRGSASGVADIFRGMNEERLKRDEEEQKKQKDAKNKEFLKSLEDKYNSGKEISTDDVYNVNELGLGNEFNFIQSQAKQKKQETQSGVDTKTIENLLRGYDPMPAEVPERGSVITEYQPFTPAEKTNMYLGLSDEGQKRFGDITKAQEMFQPKFELKKIGAEWRYVNEDDPSDYQVYAKDRQELGSKRVLAEDGFYDIITYYDDKTSSKKATLTKADGKNSFNRDLTGTFNKFDEFFAKKKTNEAEIDLKGLDMDEVEYQFKVQSNQMYTDTKLKEVESYFDDDLLDIKDQLEKIDPQISGQYYDEGLSKEIVNERIEAIIDKLSGNVPWNKQQEWVNRMTLLKYWYMFKYGEVPKWQKRIK